MPEIAEELKCDKCGSPTKLERMDREIAPQNNIRCFEPGDLMSVCQNNECKHKEIIDET